jgi:GTP-binding protein
VALARSKSAAVLDGSAAPAKAKPMRSTGPTAKAKPKKVGAPKGRAAKLARPGVKPKRASRPVARPRSSR